MLLSGWFINGLANGIPASLFILYLKYVLGANELERGLLTFTYFIAAIIGIPIWLKLSKIYEKNSVWVLAMSLACIAFAFVPWVSKGDLYGFFLITLVTGLTLGADMILPPSMQADVAEFELARTGHDRTGLLFSFWSMITKLALALSILITFPLLDALGFQMTSLPEENNLTALAVIYSLVPVVLKLVAMLIIWKHPLNAEKQKEIRAKIRESEVRKVEE